MEKKQIYRSKSLERGTGPEILNRCIKAPSTAAWVMVVAMLLTLFGLALWGLFGSITVTVDVTVVSDETGACCYIREKDISRIAPGMTVTVADRVYPLLSVDELPCSVADVLNAYAAHVGHYAADDWVYSARLDGCPPAGIYQTCIVTDTAQPLAFVFN